MIELTGKYTSARIYADQVEDSAISQVMDIINCPSFKEQTVVCMPDIHTGKSGPCGLVCTIGDFVCPEHIGVDIGCSVSMLVLDKKIPSHKIADFEHKIKIQFPMGQEINDTVTYDEKDFRKFCSSEFSKFRALWPEMLEDLPDNVSESWINDVLNRVNMNTGKFWKSIPSVGGGNHFIEYDEATDDNSEYVAGVSLHFGSRNFGTKVCSYWMSRCEEPFTKADIKEMTKAYKAEYKAANGTMKGFQDALKDYFDKKKEEMLQKHPKGYLYGDMLKGYLCDMCFCQCYAKWNHLIMQKGITKILSKYGILVVKTIMSVHNYIDLEDHCIRKSAIRAYEGEEILVPFNMRDSIAICIGKGNPNWLNSCAHGAGRKMSRSAAKKNISMDAFKAAMEGIYSTSINQSTIDESPMAYKDTDDIKGRIQETCTIKCMMVPKISIKSAEA